MDGKAVTATMDSGRKLVTISDIPAHQLGKTHTIVCTTDNGTATVKVSALSYVNAMLTAYTDAASQNAATAIYKYYEAAHAYKP